jgi:hypothetical protein
LVPLSFWYPSSSLLFHIKVVCIRQTISRLKSLVLLSLYLSFIF